MCINLELFIHDWHFFRVGTVSVAKKKPYSPFQNTSNMAEYAVARLDDLLNWGRKVNAWEFFCKLIDFFL